MFKNKSIEYYEFYINLFILFSLLKILANEKQLFNSSLLLRNQLPLFFFVLKLVKFQKVLTRNFNLKYFSPIISFSLLLMHSDITFPFPFSLNLEVLKICNLFNNRKCNFKTYQRISHPIILIIAIHFFKIFSNFKFQIFLFNIHA